MTIIEQHKRDIIGQKIKEARINAKLSRKEAVEAFGVSDDTILKWEKGHRLPNDHHKVLIAKLYKRSIEDLFY